MKSLNGYIFKESNKCTYDTSRITHTLHWSQDSRHTCNMTFMTTQCVFHTITRFLRDCSNNRFNIFIFFLLKREGLGGPSGSRP